MEWDLSGSDSIDIKINIDKNTNLGQSFTNTSTLLNLNVTEEFNLTFEGQSVLIKVTWSYNEDFHYLTDMGSYYSAKNRYYSSNPSTFHILNMNGTLTYDIGGYTGSDVYSVACDYVSSALFAPCSPYGDNLANQIHSLQTDLILNVDDIKVNAYGDNITSILEAPSQTKDILEVYNLLGQVSNFNTFNEVLIVKYTDGTFDKIFKSK